MYNILDINNNLDDFLSIEYFRNLNILLTLLSHIQFKNAYSLVLKY